MRDAYVMVGISDDGSAVVFQPVHPLGLMEQAGIPLADFARQGHALTAQQFGTVVLALLRQVQPDVLVQYPGLVAP